MPDWKLLALLLLRAGLGLLYLNAAWSCGKDQAARDWTTAETALVFKRNPRFFAMAGIAIMGLGGASILLGIFPRLGGLLLAGFTAGGVLIHFTQRDRAAHLQARHLESLPAPARAGLDTAVLQELTTSATLGHHSSALKNLTLIAVALFFTLYGGGPAPWTLIDIDRWFP